jgi:hypothetical protein
MFRQCYQLEVNGLTGSVRFNRVVLPRKGGVWDQDAREMEALDVLQTTAAEVLHEQLRERETERRRKGREVRRHG